MDPNVVIVGGGVAGLSAALELSARGRSSAIIEKAPFAGGHVAEYACKATDKCQRCGACALEDLARRVSATGLTRVMPGSTVTAAERGEDGFRLTVSRRPARVSPEKCDGCGQCVAVCPADRALVRPPQAGALALIEDNCRHFRDGSCDACVKACPRGAVDLDAESGTVSLSGRAVILATGFHPYDPLQKPRFGYRRVPGVMTTHGLDILLRENKPLPSTGPGEPRSMAFVQCVGSRDARSGRDYCSRVCCAYALRMARLMRQRFPWIEVTVFYMDIQSFQRNFTSRLAAAEKEVRLIRAMPSEIRTGSDNRPEVVYQGPDDKRMAEPFDMVALSVGMGPARTQVALADLFSTGINADGFLGLDAEEVLTAREGVFVIGAAQGPKSIEESIAHAARGAAAASQYLAEAMKGGRS